jgi:hypothetical protein
LELSHAVVQYYSRARFAQNFPTLVIRPPPREPTLALASRMLCLEGGLIQRSAQNGEPERGPRVAGRPARMLVPRPEGRNTGDPPDTTLPPGSVLS